MPSSMFHLKHTKCFSESKMVEPERSNTKDYISE